MDQTTAQADQFEAARPHLRALAYRILGNLDEADDALQEAWLRLWETDAGDIANLTGWLTTFVSRIYLNTLRSRQRRPSASIDDAPQVEQFPLRAAVTPEDQAILGDSMGHAVLVVLDRLSRQTDAGRAHRRPRRELNQSSSPPLRSAVVGCRP